MTFPKRPPTLHLPNLANLKTSDPARKRTGRGKWKSPVQEFLPPDQDKRLPLLEAIPQFHDISRR